MSPRPTHHDTDAPMTIGRLLALTSKAMRSRADEILAPFDASLTTWIVLQAAMHAPPDGLSQRELAHGMGIGGPALVRHLDRLEEKGLVKRRRDDRDRRITRITITPAGRQVHRRLKKVMHEHDEHIRSHIDPADAAAFERVLHQLYASAMEEPTPDHMRTHR